MKQFRNDAPWVRRAASRAKAVRQSVMEPLEQRTLMSTVAYWRFEGGTVGAAATTIADSSGNGLNGTAIGGPTYNSSVATSTIPQTGASNTRSLSFNGTSQRVFIPDNTKFQLTSSLTIEAWINVAAASTGDGGQGQILFRGDDRGNLDPYLLATSGSSSLVFEVENATGGAASVTAPLPGLHQWVFVAGELDGSTGAMRLYINGKLASSTTTTIRPYAVLQANAEPGLGIGDLQSTVDSEYFNGLIDEVRLSNTALTPSQFLDAGFSSISGTVFSDTNANGKQDSGEKGLAGVTVYIDAKKSGSFTTGDPTAVTTSSGSYTFAGLTAGTYLVREELPAGYKLTAPTAGDFSITTTPGKSTSGYVFADAPATASISGTVFNDVNSNGKQDAGEAGLGLWTIYIDLKKDGKDDAGDPSVTTNILGAWSFTGLTVGTYVIRIVPVTGLTTTTPTGGVKTITLTAGQSSVGNLFGEKRTA